MNDTAWSGLRASKPVATGHGAATAPPVGDWLICGMTRRMPGCMMAAGMAALMIRTRQEPPMLRAFHALAPRFGDAAGMPCAVAFDGAGRLLVGDSRHQRIHLHAPGGAFLHGWGHADFTPSAIAVGRDGRIFACDLHAGRVIVFSPGGDPIGVLGDLSPLSAPSGIGLLGDGRAVVSDTGNRRIVVFAGDGALDAELTGPADEPLRAPHGIAIDGAGAIVVVDRERRRLYRFGAEWAHPEPIDLELLESSRGEPWDVAIDRAGRIAVSVTGPDRILLLSPHGDLLGSWDGHEDRHGTLLHPTALAYGPGGILAIADTYNERVVLAKAA